MVNIIQTINYIESYEHAKKICDLIVDSGLDGIRVNLCKYNRNKVQMVIKNYISMFERNGIRDIYLDVPYPIDKARIYGVENGRKIIRINSEYIIIQGKNNEIVSDNNLNKIYINCNEFQIDREIIFYGDGEGAFRINEIRDGMIFCTAMNDFYIINGKSISCGYFKQDKAFLCDIMKSIGDMNVSLLIPFVENENQINSIRSMAQDNVSLIAKIETELGLKNIEDIANSVEGILIGRGDLALHSDYKELLPNLQSAINKVQKSKIIFCTGILQNFQDIYVPNRAELFDLLLIKQLYAKEIILSGSSDFNSGNICNLYLYNLASIKRKVDFINRVW